MFLGIKDGGKSVSFYLAVSIREDQKDRQRAVYLANIRKDKLGDNVVLERFWEKADTNLCKHILTPEKKSELFEEKKRLLVATQMNMENGVQKAFSGGPEI